MNSNNLTTNKTIHLAFESARLESLIREGKLHGSDFNCLDRTSKKSVWGMLLSAAARSIRS